MGKVFQKLHPWSGGGGDYFDCRIYESFIGNEFYHEELDIKITGMTGEIDYMLWMRDNYQQYKDFIGFILCDDNYTPGK